MRIALYAIALIFAFTTSLLAQVSQWSGVGGSWQNTDFSKSSINFNEILDGGPGKDGIPAITNPSFLNVADENRLSDLEPVMTVELEGEVPRAYPIRYLMWHEIVNDSAGDHHFAVTFCPLCNSGIVFDRKFDGGIIELGVSGLLRNSDMVMYDRGTESWWQQFTGEGIVGTYTGRKLDKIPGWMESWGDFKKRNPNGLVQDEPNARRQYGINPYIQYDSGSFSLYRGESPPHGINPVERVIVIEDNAWPLSRLRRAVRLIEKGYTITWSPGLASALDTRQISAGKDVGSIRVQDADGNDVVHDVAFAFAFHAFFPEGNWMVGH